MKEGSIFADYFRYYENVNIITKLKLFVKFAVLPVRPAYKICPWIRLGIRFKEKGHTWMQLWCERRIYKKFNCAICCESIIGKNISIPHPVGIVVGFGVVIGDNCSIYQDVTLGQNKGKFPIIGNNVIIYAGAKIIGDVSIGDNAIIGANAVVTNDVPENAIVAGVPAQIIGYRDKEKNYF